MIFTDENGNKEYKFVTESSKGGRLGGLAKHSEPKQSVATKSVSAMQSKRQVVVEYITQRIPSVIIVDGVNYPIHQWNMQVILDYDKSGDESILDKLTDFSWV